MANGKSLKGGYGYVAMLIFVAVTAAGLATLGERASAAAQRERERELEFRGGEIVRAIASYRDATPAGQLPQYPKTFDDLLSDRRHPVVRHHLRRPYRDPFNGPDGWVLIPAPQGHPGFAGVRSSSADTLLRHRPADGQPARASERTFLVPPGPLEATSIS